MKCAQSAVTALGVLALVTTITLAQPPQQPGGPRGQGPQQPERFNPLLRLFDANQDGTLAAGEIDGASAKLKELDKNKDNKLNDEELRALFPMGGRPGMFGGERPPFGPGGPDGRGGPRGSGGPGRGPGGGGVAQSAFDAPPVPKDDQEKHILAAIEAMREGPRFANVSTLDGRLLRLLAETTGAKRVVEIGTSTGESGTWFALALRSTGGHLFTHEIDPERAKVAQENFKKAGVADLVTLILGDAHETVQQHKEPIDILFLDADKEGYIDYLNKLVPLVRPGGLIIAHNMNTRQADKKYVDAITKNPDFETSFLLMEGGGVGVTMKKR